MLENMGQEAKKAARVLASLSTAEKNKLLRAISEGLEAGKTFILRSNEEDMKEARRKGLSPAMLDRLLLTEERLKSVAEDVLSVVALADPVGKVVDGQVVASGLDLSRRRVPLGVVGVIYEARPNVTVDVATLCLKTGNAVILRGGSETLGTNKALVQSIHRALEQCKLPKACVQLIESSDRELVTELLQLDKYVDMIIPRGGSGLQDLCRKQASIPVIVGGIGVCHIFVDESANLEKSLPIIKNAKVQRPSVCNALETLLVHENIAKDFIPQVAELLKSSEVVFHACPKALEILKNIGVEAKPWTDEELAQEWLSLDLNIGVVEDIDACLDHIDKYGSQHSDAILTQSMANAQKFVEGVDSAAVYVNTSTRFTDGGEFGLGAEVAVSTQKLHARGPMALDALTTYKWIASSDHLIRE